jgi:hypothetical protein
MKEVQKTAHRVLVLLIDMLVFTFQVVRNVILPTRSRKGNLLSSLLTYIAGILERVACFEKSILRQPVVFSHKYVKQALIIAVGFLFLLSSVEWTIAPAADVAENQRSEVVVCAGTTVSARAVRPRRTNNSGSIPGGAVAGGHSIFFPTRTGQPLIARRWLRMSVFRI